jgi:hypothetical protein
MFDVGAEETVALAAAAGLASIHRSHGGDVQGRTEITWTRLGFQLR